MPDLSGRIEAQVALPARRVLRRRYWLRLGLLVAGLAQLAIGAAFVAAASVPRRAAGLIPLLATFLVVLGALSVRDFAAGTVGADRLATHLAALIGLVLLIALDRAERALPPGSSWTASGRGRGRGGRDDGGHDLRTVA